VSRLRDFHINILANENAVANAPDAESDPYAEAGESPAIQRKAVDATPPDAPVPTHSGSSHPLPAEPRARIQRGLGVDLGELRAHSDAPAADLRYPEHNDPWLLGIARRNVRNPTSGWIGGSRPVTHADMLALGYTYHGGGGNWRHHLPGTEPLMIFNVLINPEVAPEAIDPNDPSNPREGDAAAVPEAKSTRREWQRLTRKTLPVYDRLRILRAAGKGDTAE
jgi:hypothetical protein